MKLATLREGGRDGTLVVVSRDLARAVRVPDVAPTLQAALDDWADCHSELASVYRLLNEGHLAASAGRASFAFDAEAAAAPLPRAYQFVDGSAYLWHVELVRRARGAAMPPSLLDDPLMYQGLSDGMLGPSDDILVADEAWGIDFEAELAVVTDDVAMGSPPAEALRRVRLVMLMNDVSLRELVAPELAKGFGFLHAKPASAFAPVAVTPDELGAAWRDARVHLKLVSELNGERFGDPDAGADMNFAFDRLVAHAARTRRLGAGTIVGSGTVSNRDPARGSSCIAERRALESLDGGGARTPYLRFGDRVRIEMRDARGQTVFGAIDQRVARYAPG